MFAFGRDFTFYFQPDSDNRAVTQIPAQSPTAYVFTSLPSVATARAGTGAIQTISSWTPEGSYFKLAVSAIPDPDPTSQRANYTYFIGINFLLKSGGVTQTVVQQLDMERVSGHQGVIEVTDEQLLGFEPNLGADVSQPQRIVAKRMAEVSMKNDLAAMGYKWGKIRRLDPLSFPALLKTLALCYRSQSIEENDRFDRSFKYYDGEYQKALKAVELDYDADKDGTTDSVETPGSTILFFR